MEFILIFSFSLALILPLIAIMNSQYAENKEDLDEAQATQVLDEIALRAHEIYYAGYPSRTTLNIYFPSGITSVNATTVTTTTGQKSELVFIVNWRQTESSIVQTLPFRVNASIRPGEGKRKILIKAEKDPLGVSYVNITDYYI